LCDLSGSDHSPDLGYPVALAIRGPEFGRLRELAEQLATQLAQDRRLTDVWTARTAVPFLGIDIDRRKCQAMGIAPSEVLLTVRMHQGGQVVSDSDRAGRSWLVTIQAGGRGNAKALKQLRVRNDQGQMVPLGALVALHETIGPMVVERIDLQP